MNSFNLTLTAAVVNTYDSNSSLFWIRVRFLKGQKKRYRIQLSRSIVQHLHPSHSASEWTLLDYVVLTSNIYIELLMSHCHELCDQKKKKSTVLLHRDYIAQPMASVQVLSVVTPPVPPSYKLPNVPSTSRISGIVLFRFNVIKGLPPCYHLAAHPSGHRTLLPVGPAYLTHLRVSLHHAHSFSSLDKHLAAERERLAALHGDDTAGEDDLGVGDEEETQELLKSDPKEWKVLVCFHVYLALSLTLQFLETRSIRCPWSLSPSL